MGGSRRKFLGICLENTALIKQCLLWYPLLVIDLSMWAARKAFDFVCNVFWVAACNFYVHFLFILHAALTLSFIVLVLMQKNSERDKNTAGGFVPRGRADLMTYITAALAGVILINTLVMSISINKTHRERYVR